MMKDCSFRVRFSEEDGKWLGQCPQHMNLFVLDDDPVEAFRGIVRKVQEAQLSGAETNQGSIFKQMDDALAGAPGPFGKMGS
jgi:hypothetical protein